MAIVESAAALALLTSVAQGVAGSRADAAIMKGFRHGREALDRVRAGWDQLDLPENQVLQRAAARAHWMSVCQVAVFYGRTRAIDIESGIDAIGAPEWLANRMLRKGSGVLSQADQKALRVVYSAARDRVGELSGDKPLPASETASEQDLEDLAKLIAEGTTEPDPAVELAFRTLTPAGEGLPETFRAFFGEHWPKLLAVNFQEMVREDQGLATELQNKWLAEIRIELAGGKILGAEEWQAGLDGLIQTFRESEDRIVQEVKKGTEAVLTEIKQQAPPRPIDGKPDTTPMNATDYFRGREKLLKEVRRTLRKEGKAALWAEGGAGKTQAALRYVDLNRASYAAILWTDASTAAGFQTGFDVFAKAAGIAVAGDLPATLQNVQRWLENNKGWLVVLDSVDLADEKLIEALSGRLPRVNCGHLLATTRHPSLSAWRRLPEIEVRPLSEDESVEFLRVRTGREEAWDTAEDVAARALAERLGGLPLALEQAAAYVDVNRWNFGEFLAAYDGVAMLERQKPHPSQYPLSVATTWRMNFEKVETEHPASADLLRARAWLAADPIPLCFVEQGAAELGDGVKTALEDEPAGARGLLAPLAEYSLIRRGPDGETYWLHPLVAEVMRDRLGSDAARWRERTLLATAKSWPYVEYENWPLCRLLLPHSLQLWAVTTEDDWGRMPGAIRLLNQCASFSYSQGQYEEAEPLYVRALEACERVLGSEHPHTVTVRGNLQHLRGLMG